MKNKILFAGFMGAILMSVGAANAATTSIATKGYVDSKVSTVQESVTELEANSITAQDVADAIDQKVTDLNLGGTYELAANKVNAITSSMTDAEKSQKFPTVAAVLAAMPTLTPEELQAIQDLTGDTGVITRVEDLEASVGTLTGTGDGSVAKSIADAISTHTTAADAKYQARSTDDLQIGTTGGVFRDMTTAEKAALASGITAEKVADYDVLAGDGEGSVAALQQAVDGLNGADGTVTTLQTIVGETATEGLRGQVATNTTNIAKNTSSISDNADAIAANTQAIANKITMPADCASGNKTCVLMVADGAISWTPVTDPIEDTTTPAVSE